MNDTLELWSLPWHARLRSLAKGFGAESAAAELRAAPGRHPEALPPGDRRVRPRAWPPTSSAA